MKVSVDFFCAVTEYLVGEYGNKVTGKDGELNEILEHLTEVERLYQLLEDEPKENLMPESNNAVQDKE